MEEYPALWRLVRAACLLDGLAAEPQDEGVRVPGRPGLLVPWPDVAPLLGDDDPLAAGPRRRLALLLALTALVARLGADAPAVLAGAARPLALPVGHALHPGPGWAGERVPGDLLDLGTGVVGLLPGQDAPVPLPRPLARAAGLEPDTLWQGMAPLADRLAGRAAERLGAPEPHAGVLLGAGGCDALTLLALGAARRGPGPEVGAPVSPVSAPRRDRVWLGPAAADPEHVRAVWMLTDPAERGLPDPLRVGPGGLTAARRPARGRVQECASSGGLARDGRGRGASRPASGTSSGPSS